MIIRSFFNDLLLSFIMSKPKKYDLKIPYEFYEVIQDYLNENPKLAYRSVSEFIHDLIRDKVRELLDSKNRDKKN